MGDVSRKNPGPQKDDDLLECWDMAMATLFCLRRFGSHDFCLLTSRCLKNFSLFRSSVFILKDGMLLDAFLMF